MTFQTKQLGATGETLAAKLLQQKKYRILQRNLRTKFGEIDILAEDGRVLVVVEVKTKTSDNRGSAIEMITPTKQQKLIKLAHYLASRYQTESVRIDVIAIDEAATRPMLKLYKGIIEFNG